MISPRRILLEPASILHVRPYSETSLLVDLFTAQHGKCCVIARGAKRPKSAFRGLMAPFIFLQVSFSGRGELKTLTAAEIDKSFSALALRGKQLYAGFYMNELLVRLLYPHDAHPALFSLYQRTLQGLGGTENLPHCVRSFEFSLLRELGYGLRFDYDAHHDQPIEAESYYVFDASRGFIKSVSTLEKTLFLGQDLLAFVTGIPLTPHALKVAKQVVRVALLPLLGKKPLASKKLFQEC